MVRDRIQKLMSLVPMALRTKYQKREFIEEWVDESGRIVLIGEAAHPTLVSTCSLYIRLSCTTF